MVKGPRKPAPKGKPKMPVPKGMHMMEGGRMMSDKEMEGMMSPELKQRYPTMAKKAAPKRKK